MEIRIGQQYRILNSTTGEHGNFQLHDLFPHQGQHIAYGTLDAHSLYLPARAGASRIDVPAKPCCFPVFPHASGKAVQKLMVQLKSLPLFLELASAPSLVLPGGRDHIVGSPHYMPILNVNRVRSSPRKDDMVRRAGELIRVWEDWSNLGQVVPFWFKEILDKEKQPTGPAS